MRKIIIAGMVLVGVAALGIGILATLNIGKRSNNERDWIMMGIEMLAAFLYVCYLASFEVIIGEKP